MSVLPDRAHAALDRMDQLAQLWALISDLLIPEKDLHCIDRDGFAVAAEFINAEYKEARAVFAEALLTINQEVQS